MRARARMLWPAVVATGLLLGRVTPAAAYSTAANYAAPSTTFGGGGRYFTGSPVDGFTCVVCHESAGSGIAQVNPAVDATIEGFPEADFEPSRVYEIVLTFSDPESVFGATVEFTRSLGTQVGNLAVIPPEELGEDELCDGNPAAEVITLETTSEDGAGRQVGVVSACGASRARFVWTAPDPQVEQVLWWHANVTEADRSGGPTGDLSTHQRRLVSEAGNPELEAIVVAGGCQATLGARQAGLAPLLGVALLWVRRKKVASGRLRK